MRGVIDLVPLLRGARGDELRVAELAVGDDASRVDRAAVTGAEPHASAEVVEVSLRERIDSVVTGGGFLRQVELDEL